MHGTNVPGIIVRTLNPQNTATSDIPCLWEERRCRHAAHQCTTSASRLLLLLQILQGTLPREKRASSTVPLLYGAGLPDRIWFYAQLQKRDFKLKLCVCVRSRPGRSRSCSRNHHSSSTALRAEVSGRGRGQTPAVLGPQVLTKTFTAPVMKVIFGPVLWAWSV